MLIDDLHEEETRETAEELWELLVLAQEMGRQLANESHGSRYPSVRGINELLHQARVQIELIQADSLPPDEVAPHAPGDAASYRAPRKFLVF